jgi:hypothetical protein
MMLWCVCLGLLAASASASAAWVPPAAKTTWVDQTLDHFNFERCRFFILLRVSGHVFPPPPQTIL